MVIDMRDEMTAREKRRRRRIRNQILAYAVLVVLVIALVTGAYQGSKYVVKYIDGYTEKVNDAMAEAETSVNEEIESVQHKDEMNETDKENETTNPLDELVEAVIQEMTIEEMVAGMFMVTPEAITGVGTAIQAGEGTKTAITENPVGGLIYSEKNFKSKEQFQEMLTNTKKYSKYPLFLAVERESGGSTAFGIDSTPNASELSDTEKVTNTYTVIAQQLAAYGINMNFAPLSYISAEESEGMKDRVFSSDAATAASLVNAAVHAMQDEEVSAVIQKFPGINVETKSLEELKNSEFLVYEMAIKNGVDCIMVSNVSATGVTGDDTPCSLSTVIITDTLRKLLGFEGVVVTDSLSDAAVSEKYSASETAIASIKAGADIIFNPSDYKAAYEGVLQAVSDGTITEERIRDSVRRIYRVKYKNAL